MKRYVLFAAASLLGAVSCNNEVTGLEPPSDPATETFAARLGVDIPSMSKTTTGVYYTDLVVGTGAEVTDKTDTVTVTYAGYLKDGTLFDNGSNVALEPKFLVAGFRTGMIGMRVGGKRKLVIPSDQGYGGQTINEGTTKIPRQSTLIFDIELFSLHTPTP
jgi:FKBP-type peptidyl-prolyl cis-trans isomerase FkpA